MSVGIGTAVTPQKTHLMIPWHGVACGFSRRPPWEWPQGHFQVDANSMAAVNCQACIEKYLNMQVTGVTTTPPTKVEEGICHAFYTQAEGVKCPVGKCKHGTVTNPIHMVCTPDWMKKSKHE